MMILNKRQWIVFFVLGLSFVSFISQAQIRDFDKPQDPYKHEVYDQGGEASLIRITENEKAISMIKSKSKDYDRLVVEFGQLKKKYQELESRLKALEDSRKD